MFMCVFGLTCAMARRRMSEVSPSWQSLTATVLKTEALIGHHFLIHASWPCKLLLDLLSPHLCIRLLPEFLGPNPVPVLVGQALLPTETSSMP